MVASPSQELFVQCLNGHFYDSLKHLSCDFCKGPEYTLCPKSHPYEVRVAACPHCQEEDRNKPLPAPVPQGVGGGNTPRMAIVALLLALVLAAGGAGWHFRSSLKAIFASSIGKPNLAASPEIERFFAERSVIDSGQSTYLVIQVRNADTVTLDKNLVKSVDRIIVSPTTTTSYILTATGPGGPISNTISVTVNPTSVILSPRPPQGPVIESFDAEPLEIEAGKATSLSWHVSGATELSIEPGVGTVTGQERLVRPKQTTTYLLTAQGPSGPATRSVTVTVHRPVPAPAPPPVVNVPPPTPVPVITSFVSDRNSVNLGESVTLSWSVRNASDVSIYPGVGVFSTQGQVSVSPRTSTTYVLRAQGPGGTAQEKVAVNVSVPSPPKAQPLGRGVLRCPKPVQQNEKVEIGDKPSQKIQWQYDRRAWSLTIDGNKVFVSSRLPGIQKACEVTWTAIN